MLQNAVTDQQCYEGLPGFGIINSANYEEHYKAVELSLMWQCKVLSTTIDCIQGKHLRPMGQLSHQRVAILLLMELCMYCVS